MNILYVTQKLPYPLNDGGNIRSFNIIKQLAKKHSLTILTTTDNPAEAKDLGELPQICSKILTFPHKTNTHMQLTKSLLRSLFGNQPYFMYKNFSAKLLTGLLAEISSAVYQAIHFNHLDVAQYLSCLPSGLKTVLDTHNILSLLIQRLYRQEPNPIKRMYIWAQWRKTLSIEKQLCQRMSLCLVCSEEDARGLNRLAPQSRIKVIPNGVIPDRPALPSGTGTPSLVFIGAMDYLPNYQGILNFCRTVLPKVAQELPDIKLDIIGRNPLPAIRHLTQNPNISVLDEVGDIYDCLHDGQILVVPLTVGGGTRLKILDAMSLKIPVVSTSIGAEGLKAVPGKHILIADDPDEMAHQIINVYHDKDLRDKLTAQAYQIIKQKYDWDIIGESLLKAYAELDQPE